jgi:hypothetical protein
MQWVQWISSVKQPGKVHATHLPYKTLCDRPIPADLIYNDATPPKGYKNVCKQCRQIEEDMRSNERFLR